MSVFLFCLVLVLVSCFSFFFWGGGVLQPGERFKVLRVRVCTFFSCASCCLVSVRRQIRAPLERPNTCRTNEFYPFCGNCSGVAQF